MAAGQCYLIVSRMHGLVLDVERGEATPGTRVMPWHKNGKDNQLWYEDPATGTIRSLIGGLCLDIEGDQKLRIMPFQQGDPNQQWEHDAQGCIRNRVQRSKVLDIMNNDRNPGATIGMWEHHGQHNQLWNIEYTGRPAPAQMGGYGGYPAQQPQYPGQGYPAPGAPGQGYPAQPGYPTQPGYPGQQAPQGYPSGQQQPSQGYPGVPQGGYPSAGATVQRRNFVIVSEMNGKVLDVKGGEGKAGADVVTWHKNQPVGKNQLWYADQQGFIRTALNDFAFDAASGKKIQIQPFNGGPNQQWVVDGKRILNRAHGEVFDIYGEKNHDGADVGAYKWKDSKNQHWRVEYV